MEALAIGGTPVLGSGLGRMVSHLLTEVIAIFRQLKDRDRNVRMLRDLLERMEPMVKQLTSFPDVERHAGKWLTDLRDLLDAAKAFAESSGRRVHADSTQEEALAQSPGHQTPIDSKRRKSQFWSTSGKALDLYKRLRHLLSQGTLLYFAYSAEIDKNLADNADKMLVKLEEMEQWLTFKPALRECGVPGEKIHFGGDAIVGEIRNNLLKGDDKWLGLCGMGGIGKTFTASIICRDPGIQQRFADGIYWITVSKDQADPVRVCNTLMESLGARHLSLEDAKSYLREAFKGKTILLILDDVWEGEPNEQKILQHLNVVSKDTKSVILVTTREKKIFPREYKAKLFPIPILSPEDSWILFSWHAFGRHGRTVPDDLESLARDVANECEGLPLALEVIGSTMGGKEVSAEEEECFDIKPLDVWERALSDLKDAGREENDYKRLFQRLQISVDNLQSARVKDCFFYFAAFPEDRWVSEEILINIWVADGLMQNEMHRRSAGEKNARLDLALLVAKSMIQVQVHDEDLHGNKKRQYRVHDVMRDLAQCNLKTIMATGEPIPAFARDCLYAPGLKHSTLPKDWTKPRAQLKGRRLSLMANDLDEFPGNSKKPLHAPDLQVLLLCENQNLRSLSTIFMDTLSSLTVLDLRQTSIQEVPDGVVRGLASLVLLDLRLCHKLETVSDEVNGLQNLEYLFLDRCGRLRNIPQLSELPNLRCFTVTVPLHDELQTEESAEEVPHPIPFHLPKSVRNLSLRAEEGDVRSGAKYSFDISSLSDLEELHVSKNISFPACGDNFDHLTNLEMAISDGEPVPRLGMRAKLEHLYVSLRGVDFQSLESYFGTNEFPFLKTVNLHIDHPGEKELVFSQEVMPKIEYLNMEIWTDDQLPESIRKLSTLKRLKMVFCQVDSSFTEQLRLLFSQQEYLPELAYVCIEAPPGVRDIRALLPVELLEREREGKLDMKVIGGLWDG